MRERNRGDESRPNPRSTLRRERTSADPPFLVEVDRPYTDVDSVAARFHPQLLLFRRSLSGSSDVWPDRQSDRLVWDAHRLFGSGLAPLYLRLATHRQAGKSR